MNNQTLEEKMVKFKNLMNVIVKENGERLVCIDSTRILTKYVGDISNLEKTLKGKVIVRSGVRDKLYKIQQEIISINPRLSLLVTYGYRSLAVQIKLFKEQLSTIAQKEYFRNPSDLYEAVHRFIAVPSIAGHPTGGAVDLVIIDNSTRQILDFGSPLYSFTKKSYTFAPSISDEAKSNRLLLRLLMMKRGFAPFDGEWWHFSYGDKEWAYYYEKENAIYEQLDL